MVVRQIAYIHYNVYAENSWNRKVEKLEDKYMECKRHTRIHICFKMVVLALICILVVFLHRIEIHHPFEQLKSEDIKGVQVVNGNRVIHSMSEEEIEQFVDVLICVTHNEAAHDYEIVMGEGPNERFVLEFCDGRIVSVSGARNWPAKYYVFIDMEPYHDWVGEDGRLLIDMFSEYYRIWIEEWMEEQKNGVHD